MSIDPLPDRMIRERQKEIGSVLEEVARDSCKRATQAELELLAATLVLMAFQCLMTWAGKKEAVLLIV